MPLHIPKKFQPYIQMDLNELTSRVYPDSNHDMIETTKKWIVTDELPTIESSVFGNTPIFRSIRIEHDNPYCMGERYCLDLGKHWADYLEGAYSGYGKREYPSKKESEERPENTPLQKGEMCERVYVGRIENPKDVNWVETLRNRWVHEGESEITMKKTDTIRITHICQGSTIGVARWKYKNNKCKKIGE